MHLVWIFFFDAFDGTFHRIVDCHLRFFFCYWKKWIENVRQLSMMWCGQTTLFESNICYIQCLSAITIAAPFHLKAASMQTFLESYLHSYSAQYYVWSNIKIISSIRFHLTTKQNFICTFHLPGFCCCCIAHVIQENCGSSQPTQCTLRIHHETTIGCLYISNMNGISGIKIDLLCRHHMAKGTQCKMHSNWIKLMWIMMKLNTIENVTMQRAKRKVRWTWAE